MSSVRKSSPTVYRGRDWEGFVAHAFECEPCATLPLGRGCTEGNRIRRRPPADAAGRDDGAVPVEVLPLDIEAMRATTERLLSEDAESPTTEELDGLALLYRGHLALLIPEIERAVCRLPNESRLKARALGGVSEARSRLGIKPCRAPARKAILTERLARSVMCLLGHLEELHGAAREPVAYCWRCSGTIKPGEPYTEHDVHAATGGGTTVYLHGGACP
ncbi:DUF6415 family natural product biosynthesis protein [Streptomyces capitiformicae]|uniref:Uncharacterized protein n=1 Tax=Streptomyces capitiformicae TaxID=2014920 RepID=A0A918Z6I8_9ACTN|nr:DUF6415 family natural product biosynthesis protein [Streptomyces capitiformicae]GHE38079.1 hypothetical protein GCM10017771_56530 [Streptomyces capitiformicae]